MDRKDFIKGIFALGAVFATPALLAANGNDRGKNVNEFNDEAGANETNKKLVKPVVKSGDNGTAAIASLNENITTFVRLGNDAKTTGYNYAKKFANAFADQEYMKGKAMYTTAVYSEDTYDGPTFVVFYNNGVPFRYVGPVEEFHGKDVFSPRFASMLLSQVVERHIRDYGDGKIIPKTEQPLFVSNLN